ncbi:MAG: thiamine pyrophosphate-binding protein [Catenulispora sp.]|nr:thiamine pyrophosphate-binding protein [Catenulispora sp.]
MPNVADVLWKMLAEAGVRRCYGIVGDALNPAIDALRRNGEIDFVHVRHEEWGVFAAVAEAKMSGRPVAVCGTAGPGVTHLINGLLDARKEGAPVIAIAGDVETAIMDTDGLEELNPYTFFNAASLYTGRLVDPKQLRAVVTSAITTALAEQGPTVISLPGDVAAADAPGPAPRVTVPDPTPGPAPDADIATMAEIINGAKTVAIFGGEGCARARDQVRALADKLNAPVGYSFKGKQWLEYDNPHAVGMTGLLGYGGCWEAVNHADVLLMLGTDFPFPQFLPSKDVKVVQVDRDGRRLGRRVPLAHGLVGDVAATLDRLLPQLSPKGDDAFLRSCLKKTEQFAKQLQHYVEQGPKLKQIRPEYLVATLDKLAGDDAVFTVDTGTACIWAAHYLHFGPKRHLFGSLTWASMASASPNAFGAKMAFPDRPAIALCGDGGFTMLALGDLLTEVQRGTEIVHIILNNGKLDFVWIEMQEAGLQPWGVDFQNPDFAEVGEALGAKGIRIERPADVEQGLKEALGHRGGPVVVDVVVDPYALSLPAHVPAATAKGFTLSVAKQALSGHLGEVAKEAAHNVRLL